MLNKPLILLFSCKSLTKQNSGINIKFHVIPTPQKQSKKLSTFVRNGNRRMVKIDEK